MKKAFTLIEIILTTALIAIGILGTSFIFFTAFRGISQSEKELIASSLAKELMEEIATKGWGSPSDADFGPGNRSRYGDSEENVLSTIDHYHDWSMNPPQTRHLDPATQADNPDNPQLWEGYPMDGNNDLPDYSDFRRRVEIDFVDDNFEVSSESTNLKRIKVIVEYSRNNDFDNPDYIFELEQIMSR